MLVIWLHCAAQPWQHAQLFCCGCLWLLSQIFPIVYGSLLFGEVPVLWLKAFHVVFMVAWFAGIFYLPRLFVYHAMSEDQASIDRFKIMERKLYNGIMTPSAVLTVFSGLWMLYEYAWKAYSPQKWLHVKLFLVILLIAYHVYCGYLVKLFREDRNRQKHTFYRIINELPVLILIGVVIMVIVRPF